MSWLPRAEGRLIRAIQEAGEPGLTAREAGLEAEIGTTKARWWLKRAAALGAVSGQGSRPRRYVVKGTSVHAAAVAAGFQDGSRGLTRTIRHDWQNKQFEDEVDPDRRLDPEERAFRASHARKAHFLRRARRAAKERDQQAHEQTV